MVEDITGDPSKFNLYNIKEACSDPPLCYNFTLLGDFLNQTSVIKALGVAKEASHWTDCNKEVHSLLMDDWMTDVAPKVVQLLNYNFTVLVYSGNLDFICNWV